MPSHVHHAPVPALIAVALLACALAPADHAPPPSAPVVVGPRVRFVRAASGEVSALVRDFVTAARAERRTPFVYVGATWCEPCRYFHAAAERGDLDAQLPALSLLEFDRDRDGERLDLAGYGSRMIPLFAVPAEDGRAGTARIEGSIHGPASPAEITPRLLAILPAP